MSCVTDSTKKNCFKISRNIVRAIEKAGWEITEDPVVRTAGDGIVVSLPVKTHGYWDEDYNDVVYYDGTDRGFSEAVRAMSRSFDAEEYDENSEGGQCIQDALDDLAKTCREGL